jgi:hypothetical protein
LPHCILANARVVEQALTGSRVAPSQPKLIFRGNFTSSDFLSQSLISFAQGENRGLVSSLKNQLLLMPMLYSIEFSQLTTKNDNEGGGDARMKKFIIFIASSSAS